MLATFAMMSDVDSGTWGVMFELITEGRLA